METLSRMRGHSLARRAIPRQEDHTSFKDVRVLNPAL
jgi:hypothetical protein